MENKHSVTNMDMVKWILQVGTKERKPGEMIKMRSTGPRSDPRLVYLHASA